MKKVLVTGAAGFIGFHLCRRFCSEGRDVFGIDNLNNYYDVSIKQSRLAILQKEKNFRFGKISLEDKENIEKVFKAFQPDAVVNLAAQAGVRYSLENPRAYISSNVDGFINILESCRLYPVKHLVFASSSSVYGANTKLPFSVHDNVDHPISLYAATKKANELMAHTYAYLYDIPSTGLRFFTVYGPWGRPDMALFKFTRALYDGKAIDVFNNGAMRRDFTFIDDIIEGVARVTDLPAKPDAQWTGENPDPGTSAAPYRLYNIGNNNPVELMDMIRMLEEETGLKARLNMLPLQPGDVPVTYADVADLERTAGFRPGTPLKEGLRKFVNWYRDYYQLGNGPEMREQKTAS